MKCFLDMDGVIVDFVRGAAELFGQDHPYHEFPDRRGNDAWSIDKFMGIEPEEFWGAMGYEFWRSLPKTVEADEILRVVESGFGRENVCLLTSPVMTEGCREGKAAWVKENYPDYSRRTLIGSAKEFCAHRGSVLIDDHHGNYEKFIIAGGGAHLLPRPWNERHEQEHRLIYDLQDFLLEVEA